MKDVAHHTKKLNRKVLRSLQPEMVEAMPNLPAHERSETQRKKQAKSRALQERMSRAPIHPTEEERNRKMKKRVPIFELDNHEVPKMGARPSRKVSR